MSWNYEEHLVSWDAAVYERPELSIRITDGHHRFVTHIPLPLGLTLEARQTWLQARREEAFDRFHCIQM